MEREEAKQEKKEEKRTLPKPKDFSLIGMCVGAIWVAGFSAYKFIVLKQMTIDDVLKSGFGIMGCFSPICVSMIFDKIFGKKAD